MGRKLLVLVPYVLAVGLVVGCIGMNGDVRKLGGAVRHKVEGLRPQPPEQKTVLTWTVKPEQIMAAVKTGVTKSAVPYTGTLTLTNQRDSGDADNPGPTWAVAVGAGNVVCYLSRIWWDNNVMLYAYCVPYTNPSMVYYIPEAQAPSFSEGEIGFIYGLADGNETTGPSGTWPSPVITKLASGVSSISVNYSMAFGCKRLYRTRTSSPSTGRDASPVYAKETTVSDAWQDVDHPWTYNVSLGTISWTGTQAWTELVPDEYGWWPFLAAPGGVQMFFCQRQGLEGKDYAEVSAKVNGVGLDFTGGTKTYDEFTLTGDGDAVSLGCDSNGDIANQATWNVTALDPLMVDFSGVSVKDRDGNAVNVRVSGGFKADPRYPATMSWSTTP